MTCVCELDQCCVATQSGKRQKTGVLCMYCSGLAHRKHPGHDQGCDVPWAILTYECVLGQVAGSSGGLWDPGDGHSLRPVCRRLHGPAALLRHAAAALSGAWPACRSVLAPKQAVHKPATYLWGGTGTAIMQLPCQARHLQGVVCDSSQSALRMSPPHHSSDERQAELMMCMRGRN